jgi:hypothetical protein
VSIEDELRDRDEKIAELEASIAASEARHAELVAAELAARPPARADGGEGREVHAPSRTPAQAFNQWLRDEHNPNAARPWWLS